MLPRCLEPPVYLIHDTTTIKHEDKSLSTKDKSLNPKDKSLNPKDKSLSPKDKSLNPKDKSLNPTRHISMFFNAKLRKSRKNAAQDQAWLTGVRCGDGRKSSICGRNGSRMDGFG